MFGRLKQLFARTQSDAPAMPAGDTLLYNAYCTRLVIAQPVFPHVLHVHRDLADPALLPHLNGMCAHVLSRGDGRMSADKYHVILHLQRVQHHVSLAVGLDGLRSMLRVLKPGGRLLVLEFSKPTNALMSKAYDAYSFAFMPLMGKLITNDSESYRYLAESIRMHPDQETLKAMMVDAGFDRVTYHNMTSGIVALHRGIKP